jgi:hypothetical protein
LALNVPNQDRIAKANPKLGEALRKLEIYSNQNVPTVPGNRTPRPPIDATRNTA